MLPLQLLTAKRKHKTVPKMVDLAVLCIGWLAFILVLPGLGGC